LYSKTLKDFFYPQDKENWFHPLLKWFNRYTKKHPPGGPPPPNFFFNPQTSLRGPPWFRKTSPQRDLNFGAVFELLTHSATPPIFFKKNSKTLVEKSSFVINFDTRLIFMKWHCVDEDAEGNNSLVIGHIF
jgi:hypothetical protein